MTLLILSALGFDVAYVRKLSCKSMTVGYSIPSKGVRKTIKKRNGLGDACGSPNVTHPINPVKCTSQPDPSTSQSQKDKLIFANKNSSGYAAVDRTGERASNQRRSVEDEVELVWEAKASSMTDPTPRLQSLSNEKSVSGATALLDIV